MRITGLGQGETNVIPGLDEGILTMRSGGVRRLYIPGDLAFPSYYAGAKAEDLAILASRLRRCSLHPGLVI